MTEREITIYGMIITENGDHTLANGGDVPAEPQYWSVVVWESDEDVGERDEIEDIECETLEIAIGVADDLAAKYDCDAAYEIL